MFYPQSEEVMRVIDGHAAGVHWQVPPRGRKAEWARVSPKFENAAAELMDRPALRQLGRHPRPFPANRVGNIFRIAHSPVSSGFTPRVIVMV